jgi:hypothetical protein
VTEGRLTHVAGQAALDEEDVTVGVAAFGARIERALATVWQGMLRPVHDLESGNQCQQPRRLLVTDHEIRAALDQHWAASDADDFVGEHEIYRDDAVLDYPQSGERIRGRLRIQASRFAQPNQKHFEVRRIVGSGGLWVT